MNQPQSRIPARRPFKWDHSVLARDTEDSSRLDIHSRERNEFGDQARHESLLDLFLDTPSFSPRSTYELSVFRRIFRENTLESIRDGSIQDDGQPVAWLHDRNYDNQPRLTNGPISCARFLDLTKLKRFNVDGAVDAHTRRVYLPNPDASTLGILALGASEHQTPAIKSLIFKYLRADTSISLQSTPGGEFILEFNIPYFAWRNSTEIRTDSRVTSNNNPLRRTFDLSFLSQTKKEKLITDGNDYLYEAHTSLCITGRAISVWTAVCLADTFFHDPDPNSEHLLPFYANSANSNDVEPTSCDLDALSVGNLTADKVSVQDPRKYFLLIVKFRMEKIQEEWTAICGRLGDKIHDYLQDPHIPLHRQKSTLETAADEADSAEKSEAWLQQVAELLTRLITTLSKDICAWNNFVSRDVERLVYGENEDLSSRIDESRWDIQESLDEMGRVLTELEQLKSEAESFRTRLSTHIAINGHRAIILQQTNTTIFQFFPRIVVVGVIIQNSILAGSRIYAVTISVISTAANVTASALSSAIEWFTRFIQRRNELPVNPQQVRPETEVRGSARERVFSHSTSMPHRDRRRRRTFYEESDSDNISSRVRPSKRPRHSGRGPHRYE